MRLALKLVMAITFTLAVSILPESHSTGSVIEPAKKEYKRFESIVNPNLPVFIFSLEILRYLDSDVWHVERIHIYKGKQNYELQTLSVDDMETPNIENYFVIQDINFDGYKDIRLLKYWGATGNLIFSAWLYDPATDLFRHEPEFEKLCRPEIHPDSKTITTHYSGGMAGHVYSNETYQWSDGKLKAIYIETQTWVKNGKGGYFNKKIKRLVNGTLQIEKDERIEQRD